MHRHSSQAGFTLILLIGITAALAILAATLVFVIADQQRATASVRRSVQSLDATEAALDSGVTVAKLNHVMSTTAEWLTQSDLQAAFASSFPAGAVVTYKVYDNLPNMTDTQRDTISYDSNGDHMVWVEATVLYQTKTTRARVLLMQTRKPFAAALPRAVTYSDTGIRLEGHSDLYAVQPDGSPWASAVPATSISAGGTYTTKATMPSGYDEVGRFTTDSTTDLKGPGSSYQSLGVKVNGSVSLNGTVRTVATPSPTGTVTGGGQTFTNVTIQAGSVGYLSDYFDQAAQASLANEAQAGGTPATAPSSWTSTGYTAITGTTTTGVLGTLMDTTTTTTYNAASDLYLPSTLNSGNLTLSRGTNTTGRTFNFQDLYVAGNLTLTGPVTVNATSLYVGGTITIKNTTSGAPAVTDSFGPLYVAGTGASSVTGLVNLLATSAYAGGSLAISNSTSTQLLDTFGTVLYSVGDLSVSGNAQFKASAVVTTNGDFTISGATNAFQDWIGKTYVAAFSSSSQPSLNHGDVTWSGTASVTSRDYLDSTADPKPLWLGRHWTRSGTYADEYGPIWVPGNSSWSITLGSTGNSTILCPLLSSTEHPQISGDIDFGSLTKPMVFFYMCDNNGIYPQVVDWAGTGTFYGLMVINESTIDFSGQVSGGPPAVEGAVFAGCPYDPTHTSGMSMSDIVLEDYDSIAFNQGVLTNVANTSSLKTTILVTQTVPGSWQQLSAK